MPDASQWLRKLGALNVSRSKAKGPAPNKPLPVLAILDPADSRPMRKGSGLYLHLPL